MRLVPTFDLRLPRILGSFSTIFLSFVALTQTSSGQSSSNPQPTPPPSADQEQFISYWTTETGWHSELQLRNNLIGQNLTVTPALRLADGTETVLAATTIKPQEVQSIDLDAAIVAAAAPQLVGTYGSAVLRYHSPHGGNLYAALMVHNTGHPFAFHIDATGELSDYQEGSREGVWWLPKDTISGYLILANHGRNTVPIGLSLYDATGKEAKQNLVLRPGETNRQSVSKLVQAAGLAGTYGGIKIHAVAHAGSVDTLHILFDETAGFSAVMKMFNHDPNARVEDRDFANTAVWTTRAPMLALSNPDPALEFPQGTILQPQIFLRNTTDKFADVSLRFGKVAGPALRLSPNETRRIDVAALQDGTTLQKRANWTSVKLTTKGRPDEVMAVAASYDSTLRYGAQTPFSDQLSFQWEGGMWEYDAQHDSLITAGNGGTAPTQAAFTIFYNQGTQRYDLEQTLQPDEQMWIDVGKLIREHVADKNGKTLPANLASGSYEFRDLTDHVIGSLFEGKVIYDKTYGNAAYGCALCCGYFSAQVLYNPLAVFIGSASYNGVKAFHSCSNNYDDVSASFAGNWSTTNTGIATVDFLGNHTGVSAGSTTSNTFGYITGHLAPPQCPKLRQNASGVDNVTTPSQHTYPNPPLTGCRVSHPFDVIINTTTQKRHQAQDTVGSGITVGTPVYAPEAGTITDAVVGKPHDPRPAIQCAGQNSPSDYVQITGSDKAITRLYHVTMLSTLAVGKPVAAGQQIGTIDLSGCTSAEHAHIQRKVGGVLVNFTTPCDNSHFDDPSTAYDDSDGTW